MPEVEEVYSCVLCHKAFDSSQALLGHTKIHKTKFTKSTVRLPAEEWAKFQGLCREHHTTTCHVLYTLVKAFNEGAKKGVVNLASPNPVQITIQQTFLGRPKSPWKTPIPDHDKVTVQPRPLPPEHRKSGCKGCYIDDDRCISEGVWKGERCLRFNSNIACDECGATVDEVDGAGYTIHRPGCSWLPNKRG